VKEKGNLKRKYKKKSTKKILIALTTIVIVTNRLKRFLGCDNGAISYKRQEFIIDKLYRRRNSRQRTSSLRSRLNRRLTKDGK
jgi:hypothetical protein